ncbi:uncharacterized protein LOC62_02G003326 [Vanrija pseudolonga]|uniref:Uncharacterized protein n=1 Tax=Vanrija pseudolonga TaxID=143232 RepID=A0AAF0Y483_9TREE|nr:hypothetical protein LOC62_02G003326 [Vanrija pseudolonga]
MADTVGGDQVRARSAFSPPPPLGRSPTDNNGQQRVPAQAPADVADADAYTDEHDPDAQVLYLDHPAHWHPHLGDQHHAAAATASSTSPPASPTALYPRPQPTPDSPTQRLRAMNIKLPSRTWWLDGGSGSRPSSPLAGLHPEFVDASALPNAPYPSVASSYPSSASFPGSSGSGFSTSPSFASSAPPSVPSTPPIDPTKLNNVPVHTPPRDSPRRPSMTRTPSGSISDDGLAALNLALSRTASPTVAETGLKLVPVDGPSSGQLERKEKNKDVIRLDSFGGEGLQRKPSGRASFST